MLAASLIPRCRGEVQEADGCLMKKKNRNKFGDATTARVKKELAKPRMSKSVRIAELKLDASRISEQSSATMPGTVDKIIASRRPRQKERAQIAVVGPSTGIEISELKMR